MRVLPRAIPKDTLSVQAVLCFPTVISLDTVTGKYIRKTNVFVSPPTTQTCGRHDLGTLRCRFLIKISERRRSSITIGAEWQVLEVLELPPTTEAQQGADWVHRGLLSGQGHLIF